jgi:hypothetical protein
MGSHLLYFVGGLFIFAQQGYSGQVYHYEAAMIELTEQQIKALEHPEATPPRLVNPQTKETFVLLPVDEYERLKDEEYDDSPWTKEELEALAWEVGESLGWADMDEYDDDPVTNQDSKGS